MAQCNHLMQFILRCCRWPVIVTLRFIVQNKESIKNASKRNSIPLLLYRKYHSGEGEENK